MNQRTVERLVALNRAFYAEFARPFSASRSLSDPALVSILPYLPRQARILDVGCGNGRLAHLLDRERPGSSYIGVDAVPELVELARARAGALVNVTAEFWVIDITQPEWHRALHSGTRGPQSDCVVALAVLHHIPSSRLRQRVLRDLAGVLAPEGLLVLSTWQFRGSARMRRKIVDWSEIDMSVEELEPGDYLLDWKRGGRGLRYCHLVDEAEIESLAAAEGFCVRSLFRAGGREGDLSLFAVLGRSASGKVGSPRP